MPNSPRGATQGVRVPQRILFGGFAWGCHKLGKPNSLWHRDPIPKIFGAQSAPLPPRPKLDCTIQALGRWSSAAFLTYIRTLRDFLAQFSRTIVGSHASETELVNHCMYSRVLVLLFFFSNTQYTDNANASLGCFGGNVGGPEGHSWAGAELVGGAPLEGLSP